MAALRSPRGANEFHQKPSVPAHHVASSCLGLVRKLQRENIVPVGVFDELSHHPLKAALAGKSRKKSSSKALAELKKKIWTPWPTHEKLQTQLLSDIEKLRKDSSVMNNRIIAEVIRTFQENGIAYIVAPFEADWQIAYMYNIGLVHAIITTDSDFWALLDSPCVFMNLTTTDLSTHILLGRGCLLAGSDPCLVR